MSNTILSPGKKIYFVTDAHLGVPDHAASLAREIRLVKWLDQIKSDAQEIFLLGDIFDYWFEYKHVVPKGYVRLLGKLAEITDAGITVNYFTGNHDMWLFDYFNKEIGVNIFRHPIERIFQDKKFFIGHGDGLGPDDKGYKIIKKIFSSKISQWFFRHLHPDFGARIAGFFSYKSRIINIQKGVDAYHYGENERLVVFSKEKLKQERFDFFVFGHRHIPVKMDLDGQATFIHVGDWMSKYSFACFDGANMKINYFTD